MIFLLAIITWLVFTSVWILFNPVTLDFDTDQNRYKLYQRGTFNASLVTDTMKIRLSIFGIRISTRQRTSSDTERHPKKTKSTSDFRTYRPLITKLIRRINLKRLILDVDTDDVVLNAKLVPVCLLLNGRNRSFYINFSGRLYFHLEATVYLYQLLYEFISFKLKQFNYGT